LLSRDRTVICHQPRSGLAAAQRLDWAMPT